MGNMYDDIATAQTARVNNFQDMYNQSNGYGKDETEVFMQEEVNI